MLSKLTERAALVKVAYSAPIAMKTTARLVCMYVCATCSRLVLASAC